MSSSYSQEVGLLGDIDYGIIPDFLDLHEYGKADPCHFLSTSDQATLNTLTETPPVKIVAYEDVPMIEEALMKVRHQIASHIELSFKTELA